MSSSTPDTKSPARGNLTSISEVESIDSNSQEEGKKRLDARQYSVNNYFDHDSLNTSKKPPSWLESSFVHLSAPRDLSTRSNGSVYHSKHGFQEEHLHLLELLEASKPNSNVSISSDSIDRVATALEKDTQRLYGECQAYEEAVFKAKQRIKTFNAVSKVGLETTTKAYESEIDLLQQEIEARQAELEHLNSLYKDQMNIATQLETYEEQYHAKKNALELKSKAFDAVLDQTSNELSQVQSEVDRLASVQLPQALFDLQVDQRGLRYPLINQLRLAYRPKGDVPTKEIEVAWSQATQLLLVLGTLLNYPSSDWKVVPLADCAKLIYRKEIYNMLPGDCRSLIAWNALLDQVLKHASRLSKFQIHGLSPTPPFPSSATAIGKIDLTSLNQLDHAGWSHAIHRMASNLSWLSKLCSTQVAEQVAVLAHSVA
ncbi:unnamed protein product [Cylindrotheca closterium]|uniref:Atg6 BARA domain-containing protein n=1 Tax=Cylindrotheca closterium TaxID=2856 RepID=A0AAD2CJ07_9STRA|nr:unnamed protein product [Cylindrotheca closterium]